MNFICLAATNLEGVAVTITTAFHILAAALRMFHPGGGHAALGLFSMFPPSYHAKSK